MWYCSNSSCDSLQQTQLRNKIRSYTVTVTHCYSHLRSFEQTNQATEGVALEGHVAKCPGECLWRMHTSPWTTPFQKCWHTHTHKNALASKTETLWILWAFGGSKWCMKISMHRCETIPTTTKKVWNEQRETICPSSFGQTASFCGSHCWFIQVSDKMIKQGDIQCVVIWYNFSVWKDASNQFEKDKVKIANRGNLCVATVDELHLGVTSQGAPLVFCHDRSTG